MSVETKKTNCHYCGYLCAFDAQVEDGRIVDITPDPTRYPYDASILAGCRRWKMNLEMIDSPERVNHPLRRCGERGSGKWERISWDEALDDIALRLTTLRKQHGSGVVASMIGGPHTSFWSLHKFMSLFGSPNNMGIGQICWNPRIWMDAITFGWTVEADINELTNSVIIWGTNPAESDNSAFWRAIIRISKDDTTKLVVVDPRYTKTARLADLWIAPNPGTDCTLMLSMINYIIEQDLYDKQFVQDWCVGFDELVAHVKRYSLEMAAEVCGVAADDIRKAAEWFADSPAAMVSGRGIDQIGKNVLPTHRARCILFAITGNIDKPGSCLILDKSDFVEEVDLECTFDNWETLEKLSMNTGITPLQSYSGYAQIMRDTNKLNRRLPARYLTSAHPDLVLKAMETGEPYPVRALIVEATNPLLTYADTHRVYRALMGLDLIVVIDYFMTPTAAIADFVLPSAAAMERATFQAHGGVANIAYGGAAAVESYYERKCDYDIFRELGCRLGQADAWMQETFEQACADTLAPTGMDWETYCQIGICSQPPRPYKHLELDEDGNPKGFGTASGKIELASSALELLGGDRLPCPADNRTLCSDAFIAERESQGWVHLPLITGGRKQPYNASMYMNNPAFREKYPFPVVEMSRSTAEKLGLKAGEGIVLAADNGEARFVVDIIEMKDDLLHADYGWWHPEWDVADGRLGGIWESNINTLTSCSLDQSEPMIGTWSYNALDCMVASDPTPLTTDAIDKGHIGNTRSAWCDKLSSDK